uniref:Uncharacterized protein n=1 Tax=Ralstonia solanacearum TaxID=305 RepID=A0A0S4U0A0_RALSL|nr:conserved protein of unknown function [Ralstonia solanacearum]
MHLSLLERPGGDCCPLAYALMVRVRIRATVGMAHRAKRALAAVDFDFGLTVQRCVERNHHPDRCAGIKANVVAVACSITAGQLANTNNNRANAGMASVRGFGFAGGR